MKIIGQSTLMETQAYTHLGYTAATYEARVKDNWQLLGGGIVALSLGAAMAFSLVVGKTARGWTTFSLVRRQARVFLVGGLVLMAVGVASIAAALTRKAPELVRGANGQTEYAAPSPSPGSGQ